MNFEVIKLPGFDNEPVKFKNDIEIPQCKKSANLPDMFFTNITIGATNSGKTFAVVKLLKYYEKKKIYYKSGVEAPQRIILFTLTPDTNPIYTSLKHLDPEDIHAGYSDAKLQEVLDDIEEKKKEAEAYNEFYNLYKRYSKLKNPENSRNFTYNEWMALERYDFDIENYPEPVYRAPCVCHILFDDLLCSGAFKATGNSLLSNLSTRSRHLFSNLYFMAQTANQIPRIIRSQSKLFLLYRYNSKSVCKDLFEQVSGAINEEEFNIMYEKFTEQKFSFLCIDNTHSEILFKQNFEKIIKIKK